MSDRTPGYGEITGRLDDLERENASLRNMLLTVLIVGVIFYLDLKGSKEAKGVD